MAKKVNITLTVEADKLFKLSNPTQAEINDACSLSDDNNGSGSVSKFETNVYLNNDVRWKGDTSDRGYTIAIDSIAYESTKLSDPSAPTNENFFDDPVLEGNGGRNSKVLAKVKNDSSLVGKLEVYMINFSIYDSPSNFKRYQIDPKLKANT